MDIVLLVLYCVLRWYPQVVFEVKAAMYLRATIFNDNLTMTDPERK